MGDEDEDVLFSEEILLTNLSNLTSQKTEEVCQNTCKVNVSCELAFSTGQQRIQTASLGIVLGAEYTSALKKMHLKPSNYS